MRKVIPIKTDYMDFGSQVALGILVNEASSKELCLGLTLLKDQLVNRLDLIFQNFALAITLGEEKYSYCQDLLPADNRAEVLMARNDMQLVIRYLLKYYRDGFAEVYHIDLDFKYQDQREFTIVFEAELSR